VADLDLDSEVEMSYVVLLMSKLASQRAVRAVNSGAFVAAALWDA
jgi:hypothetical protein